MMMMMMIIVSLTTFSIVIGSRAYLGRNRIYIVIGSLHAYLTRNCRAITWVSNCRSPIWTFCNRIPVIGYPRDFNVYYARFNGCPQKCFLQFSKLTKTATDVFAQKKFSKDIVRNFKSASRFVLVQFWNYSRDHSLNCTPLGPITITNRARNFKSDEISRAITPFITCRAKLLNADWLRQRAFSLIKRARGHDYLMLIGWARLH